MISVDCWFVPLTKSVDEISRRHWPTAISREASPTDRSQRMALHLKWDDSSRSFMNFLCGLVSNLRIGLGTDCVVQNLL